MLVGETGRIIVGNTLSEENLKHYEKMASRKIQKCSIFQMSFIENSVPMTIFYNKANYMLLANVPEGTTEKIIDQVCRN